MQLTSKAQDEAWWALWFTGLTLLREHNNFYLWTVPELWLLHQPLADTCDTMSKVYCDRVWKGEGNYTYCIKRSQFCQTRTVPTSLWRNRRNICFITVSNNLNLKYHLPLAITATENSLPHFLFSWFFWQKSGLLCCSELTTNFFYSSCPLSSW